MTDDRDIGVVRTVEHLDAAGNHVAARELLYGDPPDVVDGAVRTVHVGGELHPPGQLVAHRDQGPQVGDVGVLGQLQHERPQVPGGEQRLAQLGLGEQAG